MNKERLQALFEGMKPDVEQKSRMRNQILMHLNSSPTTKRSKSGRLRWLAIPAVGLIIGLMILFNMPFFATTPAYAISLRVGEDGEVVKLADREGKGGDYVTSVSYVDSRPGLEFYIESEDTASIHITTETEYIYATDWTKTQHEKFWNVEYYQDFDEERGVSIADYNLLYDKELTFEFDDQFRDYDQIWYRWTPWNMYRWAAEDHFSRFHGVGLYPEFINVDRLNEQEKMDLAAGNRSSVGHMNLEDYPDHLKEDTITITITDREGNVTTKAIHVKVDNNKLGQTVVTARLIPVN